MGDQGYLGDVVVLGMGQTAEAVARYLLGLGAERVSSVTVVGGAKSAPGDRAARLSELGATVVPGTDEVSGAFDLAVASPGISEFSDLFGNARAASRRVIGEPELAWEESPERWIGITGTNGKTTTTSLTAHLLNACGMPAAAVGNIGPNVIGEVARRRPDEWIVAELSSFQLATTERLEPRVACLLNITPDHAEWHRTHANYIAAKERIFANLGVGDLPVLVVDDPECARIADELDARGLAPCRVSVTRVQDSPNRAYLEDGRLIVELDGERHELPRADELGLEGPHNYANALVAAAAALFVGADPAVVSRALVGFAPLEHRIEPVATIAGVRYVNDSKATNTDAVEKAVGSFPAGRVVVLVGGHDKGGDLTSFCDVLAAQVKCVVAYGEAQGRLGAALELAGCRVLYAPHMADAVEAARAVAEPGDVVLLSPACSSYDEFSGFEERGHRFKDLVRELADDERRSLERDLAEER